ncbi:MAG: NAD(P)H-dependent oxidoreductase [Pseudomonadota bacterium]
MKVMALNSSPRVGNGSKTEMLLNPLIEGMREAGAEVEVVNLKDLKIKLCLGCFTCWSKTPGRCVLKDDMTELLPRFLSCDLAVLASPLYHFTVNAAMKAFIERTLPAIEPFLRRKDGKTYHPLRGRHPGIIALSVAGFPEDSVFSQLSSYMRFMYRKGLLAEVYRPGAETLAEPYFKDRLASIQDAARQAGRELASTGAISPGALAMITEPIEGVEDILEAVNLGWQACIEAQVTPKEFSAKGLKPRPTSLETFMTITKLGFTPGTTDHARSVIQFIFSGNVSGGCYFVIDKGEIGASLGRPQEADLTVRADFDDWMNVFTGAVGSEELLGQGQAQVSGDPALLRLLQGSRA